MSYPGGKSGAGVYQTLISQIPPHARYLELFAGGAAVLRLKEPARSSIAVESEPNQAAALQALALPGLTVVHGDALAFLRSYTPAVGQPGDFVFADPPYLAETLQSRGRYRHGFHTPAQHRALLDALRKLSCPVMLCGYTSPLYQLLLADWRTLTYQAVDRRGNKREEWLWMNYPEPRRLHDAQHVGADYRERERIKKKRDRWLRRLEEMSPTDRLAILAAIDDWRDRHTGPGGS